MAKRVGIVGLGRIGMPSSKAFIKAGYEVVGYARRPEVIEKFKSIGGIAASSPREVAEKAETVIVLVLNDPQVLEVVTGPNGILKGAGENSMVVGMATINRENQERVAGECESRGVRFVDCPFTGGPARVENGTLTLIVAAPPEHVEACRPVLEVIGRIVHVGDRPGLGQSVKHCNQLLVSVTHAAVLEMIHLAKKQGLDARLVCDIVASGIGGSDYFRLLSKSILDHTPSPGGLGQLAKDIGIVMNTARNNKLPLYVTTAAYQYFLAGLSQGMENMDGADLMKVVERMTDPRP
jgi:3-hydroxyisobutyrate dehydrogenase-like beta-hydroxyacid dehydrogenase